LPVSLFFHSSRDQVDSKSCSFPCNCTDAALFEALALSVSSCALVARTSSLSLCTSASCRFHNRSRFVPTTHLSSFLDICTCDGAHMGCQMTPLGSCKLLLEILNLIHESLVFVAHSWLWPACANRLMQGCVACSSQPCMLLKFTNVPIETSHILQRHVQAIFVLQRPAFLCPKLCCQPALMYSIIVLP
jgi:hypothetical protein